MVRHIHIKAKVMNKVFDLALLMRDIDINSTNLNSLKKLETARQQHILNIFFDGYL